MGKVIGNVGLLDITTATSESINGIERILNAGAIIYSAETAGLVPKLNVLNIGTSVEVPENYKLLQGQIEMDGNYFKSIKEPVSILALGQVIIKQDVSADDIENRIKDLILVGQLLCPQKLLGTVQLKCSKITGEILTYSGEFSIKVGKFNIDNQFLKSVDKPLSLALIGKTTILDDIDENLFNDKVESIQTIGKVLIKEEYLEIFNRKSVNQGKCKLQVIPKGYTYMSGDLHLDSLSIKRFDHARLYTDGMVELSGDVTNELLKNCIDKIFADEVVCRRELKEAVYGMCSNPSARICDYTGKVFIVDGDRRLTQSELKYIPGPVTYIVHGTLSVNNDISPEIFMEKVENIDNFGEIICDDETCGLIHAKLRVSEGEIMDLGSGDEINIGYLKL